MCKFENLIEHISVNKIKIVNLSMGSVNKDDWQCFYRAAKSNKIFYFLFLQEMMGRILILIKFIQLHLILKI